MDKKLYSDRSMGANSRIGTSNSIIGTTSTCTFFNVDEKQSQEDVDLSVVKEYLTTDDNCFRDLLDEWQEQLEDEEVEYREFISTFEDNAEETENYWNCCTELKLNRLL